MGRGTVVSECRFSHISSNIADIIVGVHLCVYASVYTIKEYGLDLFYLEVL